MSQEFSFRACLFGAVKRVTLGCLLMFTAAHAQFNGPPSATAGQEINRPATLTSDRTLLFPRVHDLLLTSGDLVTVHVFGQSDYLPTVRLGTDGNVLLPLIGIVHLEGLSITGAEQFIAQRLIDAGMYRNPQVTLQLVEGPSAVVTVVGETHGIVPVQGSRHLLDVLSQAGGLTPASSHVITIHRPGQQEPLVVDLGSDPLHSELANIPVFAGDTIVVSRIGVVYMIGAFKTTGTIPLTPYAPLTLMQATALSGGTTFDGKYEDLRIIRTVGDKRTVVKLDIKAVLYGKVADPILQPSDIVFLPSSAVKASIANGSLGTLLGIVGLLVSITYR